MSRSQCGVNLNTRGRRARSVGELGRPGGGSWPFEDVPKIAKDATCFGANV